MKHQRKHLYCCLHPCHCSSLTRSPCTVMVAVVLAWQWFGHGVVVNPEAQKLQYQQEDLGFFGVKLTPAEIAILDNWDLKLIFRLYK